MNIHPIVERVAQGLRARAALTEDDVLAVCTLPFTFRTLDASSYLVREGETPEQCALLLSGFAYRHKVTSGRSCRSTCRASSSTCRTASSESPTTMSRP